MEALRIVKNDAPSSSSLSKENRWISEEVYWNEFYTHPDCEYEWNNGYLEEKPMADLLSIAMYRWFLQLLEEYLKVFPVGQIMALEMGFRLNLGNRVSIRKPDLAFILHSNPVEGKPWDRSFHGICDLCIEMLSDSNPWEIERDTVLKKAEYAKAGVSEYYILDRLGTHTAFYCLNERGIYEPLKTMETGVIRSTVLEHFAFRLQHLEKQTPFEALINDSIYQPFLLKSFREERLQKEQALKREEQERLQKEQAFAEIERLRSLLKNSDTDLPED